MTINRASLTKLTARLLQSRDYSYYVSRPILASPPLWLQIHTHLCAHNFAHSPTCDVSLGSLTLPAPEVGDFMELLPFLRWDILFGVNKSRTHALNQSHTTLVFISLFTVSSLIITNSPLITCPCFLVKLTVCLLQHRTVFEPSTAFHMRLQMLLTAFAATRFIRFLEFVYRLVWKKKQRIWGAGVAQ